MNFYADSPTHGTDLASQADPTSHAAGDNVIGGGFGNFEQAAPAAEIGGGAAGGETGKGPAQVKKKLSTLKKMGIGAAVIVGLAAVAVVMTPTPPTVPSGLPRSQPVTVAQPGGMLGGAAAPDGATLMGATPPTAGAAPAPAASPAIIETPTPPAAEAPVVQAATAAPAPTPAPAPVPSASTPRPAAPAAAMVVASAPIKSTKAMPAAAKAAAEPRLVVVPTHEAKSADPVDLAARVAVLERRLAKYEGRGAAPRHAHEAVPIARELPPADRSATMARALNYVGSAQSPLPQPMQPIARQTSPVSTGDSVRVLGISTRQGVATALVEFGGTKHRVAVGDRIAGLGPVSSVALDAAGNPVIEINGVRYE